MPMHLAQYRHPRGVLIEIQTLKSNGSLMRHFEDDADKRS